MTFGILGTAPFDPRNAALAQQLFFAAAAAKSGNPYERNEDGGLALVTENATAAAGLTQRIRVGSNGGVSSVTPITSDPTRFRFVGGLPLLATERPSQAPGSGVQTGGYDISVFQFKSCSSLNGGLTIAGGQNVFSNAWRVEMMFDGSAIDLVCLGKGSNYYRVVVDGQYIEKDTPYAWGGNSVRYVNLAFGTRAVRRLTLEGLSIAGFAGVNIAAGDTVWAPPARPSMAFVGDSLVLGANALPLLSGTYFAPRAFSAILGDLLGIDVWQLADGGTGYVADDGGTGYALKDRVRDLGMYPFDLVFVCAGFNDQALYSTGVATLVDLQNAALTFWHATRAEKPQAPIVVTGIWPGSTGPSATMIALENALKAAFDAWGDSNSFWIPLATASPPLIFGTGKSGATNGSGNSDNYIDTDGVHAVTLGHEYAARRLRDVFLDRVYPAISRAR